MKKINVTKKAVKVILNILMPLIVFLFGVLLATCLPEKQSTLVRKNRSGGSNQLAIRQLPAVRSFEDYLRHIEEKDGEYMWNNSSCYRKRVFGDLKSMMYDYCLTSNYQVQYIIPIGEGNRLSKAEEYNISSPNLENERTFSFYALLRFEDDVRVEGEVDMLKKFQRTTLEEVSDSSVFESLFEPVVEEVYEFVDRRFVIDSTEFVKKELRDYMMDMSMRSYALQDWRFPVLFAEFLQLPIKEMDKSPKVLYERLGHSMLSEVVMIEEDGVWKLSRFRTIASSRW